MDLPCLARDLAALAADAGRVVMGYYAGEIQVTRKSDDSPVTAADHEAEALIERGLARIAPGIPVVGEEAMAKGRAPKLDSRFFLVDPLDGTKEFLRRNGEFTVNIGLIENKHPVAGALFAPVLKRLWYGSVPGGAYEASCDAAKGHAGMGDAKRVSVRPAPADGIIAIASRSHRDPQTEAYLARHLVKSFLVRGSSLKFGLIASGEADIYPRTGPTNEWDTAAGDAVLRAAGGRVETFEGGPLLYAKPDFLNGPFVAIGGIS